MADTTGCQYSDDGCGSGEVWAMDENTNNLFNAFLWTVCGIMGACMAIPFLYIILNGDGFRAWWKREHTDSQSQARHEQRAATRRMRSADQAFGSVV